MSEFDRRSKFSLSGDEIGELEDGEPGNDDIDEVVDLANKDPFEFADELQSV